MTTLTQWGQAPTTEMARSDDNCTMYQALGWCGKHIQSMYNRVNKKSIIILDIKRY